MDIPEDDKKPATIGDVRRIVQASILESEHRIIERMRDMQTELLHGFEAFSGGLTLRTRKLEADKSNLEAALSGRIEILENRLHQIEQRLGGAR